MCVYLFFVVIVFWFSSSFALHVYVCAFAFAGMRMRNVNLYTCVHVVISMHGGEKTHLHALDLERPQPEVDAQYLVDDVPQRWDE